MKSLQDLSQKVIAFRDARDWKQFHNPKDMALSLVLEASELMEHFQWKNGKEIEEYFEGNKEEIADEMADVLHCLLIMSSDLGIHLDKALLKKIKKNESKYPVKKAKGRAVKYNKL